MRIIGIDLGTVCCGYGIIEVHSSQLIVHGQPSTVNRKLAYINSGEIRMDRRKPLPERLKVLYNSLKVIFDKYKPTCLSIEKIFYHKSIRSAFTLGSTRGVVMLLAAENELPLFEYNSTEIKMALTGYGRAEKRQVKEMVKRILNLNSSIVTHHPSRITLSEDEADALALCICHINSVNKLK